MTGTGRQKITYHPSKRDQSVVWDLQAVDLNAGHDAVDPPLCDLVMDAQTPQVQAEDMIMDVEVTRWGFLRALSHEERRVCDPAYRAELALEERRD